MEAVGDQVSPTNSLFFRSPITTILNFNLSRLPSDCIFSLYKSMHGVIGSPFFGYSTIKLWLLIRYLISFCVAFGQGLFMSSDNFVTSEKVLGYRMKWETSEPYSPKSKPCEIFLQRSKTHCVNLYPFLVAFNNPFYSDCLCLLRSRILWRAYLLLTFGWDWLTSRVSSNISIDIVPSSDSLTESIASIYYLLSSGGIIESSSGLSPLSSLLQVSDNIFPSPNCVNVVISPVCYLGDIVQGVYVIYRRIAIYYG